MELIGESVFLKDDINEENPCNVFYNSETDRIICVDKENIMSFYILTGDQQEIADEHRDEILSYCLSRYTKEDEVSLGDIFVHGKYVKKLSE